MDVYDCVCLIWASHLQEMGGGVFFLWLQAFGNLDWVVYCCAHGHKPSDIG